MIHVFDDFTHLQRVILGDINLGLLNHVNPLYQSQIEDIFHETISDLNAMQRIFEDLDIEVYRPVIKESHSKAIETPYWRENGIRNALSPRDSFAVIGNTLLEAASHKRSAHFEDLYYKELFVKLFKEGAQWVSMPKPSLEDSDFDNDDYLNNLQPILDTAQIARLGDKLLISTSGAGNKMGVEWIQRHFGNRFDIVVMDPCFSGHMDAQVKIIRPGLIVSPYPKEKHPDFMQSWEIIPTQIFGTAPEIVDTELQDDDWDNTYFQSSMLSYDENTVFVFEHYKKLYPDFIKLLERKGVDCVFLPFTHQYWFSQGSTCITCDLNRAGSFEDYAQ